ncbi:MAG: hypothetical protein AAF612_03380 [Planctomycetota bacterium]
MRFPRLARTPLSPLALAVCAGFAVLSTGCVNEAVLERRANAARAAGDLDAEIGYVLESTQRFPGSYESQLRLGTLYLEADQPLRAETPLALAHEIGIDWQARRVAAADLLAEAYGRQNAADELARFVRDESSQFGTVADYLREGRSMARIGDHDAAATALEKAAYFADPTDPEPHLAQGQFYESISDREAATIAFRHAYTVAPNDPATAEALRGVGLVPGPTLFLEPPRPAIAEVEPGATTAP